MSPATGAETCHGHVSEPGDDSSQSDLAGWAEREVCFSPHALWYLMNFEQ